jgi:xenotropic and polytropic retrovirus receptor 1
MKFSEHLSAHLTPEWISQYISYEDLKEKLYAFQKDGLEIQNENEIKAYTSNFDQEFLQQDCKRELDKINTFFSEKLAEAQRKFAVLKEDCLEDVQFLKDNELDGENRKFRNELIKKTKEKKLRNHSRKQKQKLKLAFSEFYLSLILIQNYQALNFTGFRKILKKHDKLFKTDSGNKWRIDFIEPATFYTNKKADDLIVETENFVIENLEGGNRRRAMERLKIPPLESKQNYLVTFRLGLYVGMLVILSIAVVGFVEFLRRNDSLPFNWKIAIKIYRGPLLIIIHLIFFGFNTYVWRSTGVNHVLIFEIDPRDNLLFQEILEMGAFVAIFWMLTVIGFVVSAYFFVEYNIYAIIFFTFLTLYLFNPFNFFRRSSRFWLIKIFWRIITAPFHKVKFADFWLADQLNSFDFFFVDLQFIICYYFAQVTWAPFKIENQEPCTPSDYRDLSYLYNILALILSCIPAWLRFLQCLRRYRDTKNKFPHLANALKYSTTFIDTIALSIRYLFSKSYENEYYSPFLYLWIFIRVSSSSYRIWWDLKMDWGFFDKNAGDNKYLREVCIYSSKWYYYFAIIQNVVLRFIWIVRIYDISYLNTNKEVYRDVVATILAFLEIYRRFVWNFIRLENEHLNNCGQFRAVRDIFIKKE